MDHFDDLLLGHFDFVIGLDGVAVGEFAAVGDGAELYQIVSTLVSF